MNGAIGHGGNWRSNAEAEMKVEYRANHFAATQRRRIFH
jgi:hypothetical protein